MSQDIRKKISKNIKKLRDTKKVTRENLSIFLGFDSSYISKLENCKINITLDRLQIIADYFSVEPWELLK